MKIFSNKNFKILLIAFISWAFTNNIESAFRVFTVLMLVEIYFNGIGVKNNG